MSNPQRVFVGGEWRPLMTGGKPAKECCCAKNCHVIARGLCGTAPWPPCGFREFDVPGEDPSCPPKYYRTKTTTITETSSGNSTEISHSGEEYIWLGNVAYSGNLSTTLHKYVDGNGDCKESCSASGSHTSTDKAEGYGITHWDIAVSLTLDNCDNCWVGTQTDTADPPLYGNVTYTNPENCGPSMFSAPSGTTTTTKTSSITTYENQTSDGPVDTGPGMRTTTSQISYTQTITLSDEITLDDQLREKVCQEELCHSFDDPPSANGCRYCCTDRGNGQEGLAYKDPLTPEGCIVPDSSSLTWEGTNCNNPTTRSGRSAKLAVWFKDLIPGATYKATITYKRCSFGKNEEGETIYPSCSWTGPCLEENPENYETLTDEVTFTADAWAEILAWDCQDCDILLKKCQLEDEANDWNLANPEETPRSVECTTGGFDVPVANEKYTWFYSCDIEKLQGPQ